MFKVIRALGEFIVVFLFLWIASDNLTAAQEARPITKGSAIPKGPEEAPISSGEPIPTQTVNHRSPATKPAEYLSWSLFLICNNTWLKDQSSPQIRGLYNEFMGFGRAIGAHHAAVWFWTKTPANINESTDLADAVDANRSQAFCQKFGLDSEKSPHVVVTIVYPDLNADIGQPVILRLGGMRAENIEALLSSLTRQVTSNKLAQGELDRQAWRLGWMQTIQKTLCAAAPLFKTVKATVGVVEVTSAPAEICK
jgi:hypothetical protein